MSFSPRTANLLAVAFLILLPPVFFWRETLGLLTLGDQDAVFWFFPIYKLVAEQVKAGHLPLWNPYLYGGMPLFAQWQAGVLDPLNWIYLFGATSRTLTLVQEASFAIALLSTFAYARSLSLSRRAGIFAAVIYGLSGFAVGRTIYPGLLHVFALAPLVLWFVERLYRTGRWREVGGGALIVAWQVFAAHPQPLAYSSMLAASYALFCALFRRESRFDARPAPPDGPTEGLPAGAAARSRFLLQCSLVFVFGAALSAVQLVPAAEFASRSVRRQVSYEFFTLFSLHPLTLLTTLFPFFHGQGRGIYRLPYWGPYWHNNEAQIYLGALALSLAVAGALLAWRVRMRVGIFWSVVAVVAVGLSIGNYLAPIARLVYQVPVLGSFRSPNRHWMEVTLAVATLAGYALDRLLRGEARQTARDAWIAAAILVVLCAAVSTLVLGGGETAEKIIRSLPDLKDLPEGFLRQAGPEFYMPVLSAACVISALIIFTKTRHRGRWYALLLGVLIIDFNLYATFAAINSPPGLERQIGQTLPPEVIASERSEGLLRCHVVLNPAAGEFSPYEFYGHEMATGYDPLMSERYKLFSGIDEAGRSHLPTMLDARDRTLDLLNIRYILVAPQFFISPPIGASGVVDGGVASVATTNLVSLNNTARWRELRDEGVVPGYQRFRV